MADIINLQELADAKLDAQSLERFINGGVDEEVLTRLSQQYPTMQNFLLQFQKHNSRAYKTYTLMDADKTNIPAKSKVTVTNDETASNNGDWQWDGSTFTKSAYDPLTQAKGYADSNPLFKPSNIASAVDLNTISDNSAYYVVPETATLANINNKPENTRFHLHVEKLNNFLVRQVIETDTNNIYHRTGSGAVGSRVWSAWKKVLHRDEVAETLVYSDTVTPLDLNTYDREGILNVRSATIVAATLNKPAGYDNNAFFTLTVKRVHSDGYYINQWLESNNTTDSVRYFRSGRRLSGLSSAITWSAWKTVATMDSIPPAAQYISTDAVYDLNTYDTEAEINFTSQNAINNMLNKPVDFKSAFARLTVKRIHKDGYYINQWLENNLAVQTGLDAEYGPQIFFRSGRKLQGLTGAVTWLPWQRIAHSNNSLLTKMLLAGSDINLLEESAVYKCISASRVASVLNKPEGESQPFTLTVQSIHPDNFYFTQKYESLGGSMYWRTGQRTAGNPIIWANWVKIADSNDLKSLIENAIEIKTKAVATGTDYVFIDDGKIKAEKADGVEIVSDLSPYQYTSSQLLLQNSAVLSMSNLPTRTTRTSLAVSIGKQVSLPNFSDLLMIIPAYGQSNSTGVAGTALNGFMTDATTFAENVFMFAGVDIRNNYSSTTNNTINGATLIDFQPLKTIANALGQGATVVEGCAKKLGYIAREELSFNPKILAFAAGKGATVLSGLVSGSVPYTNLMTALDRAVAIAAEKGLKPYVPAVCFTHGEGDQWNTNYKADLLAFYDTLNTAIKTKTGQVADVKFLVSQPFGVIKTDSMVVTHELARDNPNFILCGAPYGVEISSDYVHYSANGHIKIGEYYAKALAKTFAGQKFKPCQMESATLVNSTTIDITFHVPVGKLTLDATATDRDGNWGLEVFNSSGTQVAIANKSITASNKVRLTLDSAVTSGTVKYGLKAQLADGSFLASDVPRGRLRDSDTSVKSSLDGNPLFNWCVYSKVDF